MELSFHARAFRLPLMYASLYPALFVSEQQKGREKINPGVVQMVVKNAAIKVGLEKNIHPHTLRHSFATDLLRNNTNIVHVKELLDHASIQVTMAYTYVVNENLHQIHRLKLMLARIVLCRH